MTLTSTIINDYVALFAKYVHTRNKTVELVLLSSSINGWNPASSSQTSKLLPTVTLINFNFLIDARDLASRHNLTTLSFSFFFVLPKQKTARFCINPVLTKVCHVD